jgi:hypothetical protein
MSILSSDGQTDRRRVPLVVLDIKRVRVYGKLDVLAGAKWPNGFWAVELSAADGPRDYEQP